MSGGTIPILRFDTPAGLPLEAPLDGGRLTSDGGLPWLAEADQALGLYAALAACVPEWRCGPVRHRLVTLVRQRVYQIACGYADQNDADTWRADPLLKLVCGWRPDSDADLAASPPALAWRMPWVSVQLRSMRARSRACHGTSNAVPLRHDLGDIAAAARGMAETAAGSPPPSRLHAS